MKHKRYNGAVLRKTAHHSVQVELNTPAGRQRRHFKTELQARAWVDQQGLAPDGPGLDVADALRARSLLPAAVSLTDAARAYLRAHPGLREGGLTLAEAAARFLQDKAGAGLRDRSYRSLRILVNRLAADLGAVPLGDVTGEGLLDWLDARGLAGTTRDNYRRAFSNFFNWCVRARYLPDNPAALITRPRVDPPPPAILGPDQLRALLDAAQSRDPACIAPIALGAFAGLRTGEIARLHWSHIHGGLPRQTPSGYIHVGAAEAKTRVQRYVAVNGALAAWLSQATVRDASPISPRDYRRRFQRLRRAAGIDPWPANALRHSFASYHLALHEDPGKTAHELGHRNPAMLFRHYRNLVTRAEAARWFAVLPREDGDPS